MAARSTLNIFISYGRRDGRDLALHLRDDLQRLGYSVWLDLNEIPGGADWGQQIEDAIEHCDITLALMSHASYESQWCRAEQLRALRKGKRIIPLRLQSDAEIPLSLEHLNYLDFTDMARYDAMFRDLTSDMIASAAFGMSSHTQVEAESPYQPIEAATSRSDDEKRDAASFRQVLRDLRGEDWLGARAWWPYFLFTYLDVASLAQTLEQGVLQSPNLAGQARGRWERFVRFYFRPRTPDAFFAEGFTTATQTDRMGTMAYLLFDLESLLLHPEAKFSNGDPAKVGKTYKTATYFRELPFEQIYHDSWFSADERDEIMHLREAQVLLPEQVGLEALQLIWLRSEAEYETLHQLLSPQTWQHWRDKITPRTDYHLFNHKRLFVERASCRAGSVWLCLNMPQRDSDREPFVLHVQATTDDGKVFQWQRDDFVAVRDLQISLPTGKAAYALQVRINGELAYEGRYAGEAVALL